MSRKSFGAVALLLIALFVDLSVESDPDFDGVDVFRDGDKRILSRKKRFLIFPEGSSLQLIFDWVVPMVGMPNLFTMGITAALAWQLPHDPTAPFRRPAEVIHRRVDKPDNKTASHLPFDVRPPLPYKYQKKYNAPQKLNYYNTILRSPAYREGLRRKQGYVRWNELKRPNPNPNYINLVYDQVHRTTRRDLYTKLGKFLATKQLDARECVLKIVCQVGKFSSDEKGTFGEEILRTIFRVRTGRVEEEDEYDFAAKDERDCNETYPTCNFFK